MRAINKQEKFTGALFREGTKAECLNRPNGITPSFQIRNGVTNINLTISEEEYLQVCFNYIHQNPVKANLVKKDPEWEFSSAKDYWGTRKWKTYK